MDTQLWRGLALYRVLALGYTVLQYALVGREYAHPVRGVLVLAVMAVWTVVATLGYARPARRGLPLLTVDLVVSLGVVLAAGLADSPAVVAERSLPMLWAAAAVVAWALARGWVAGLAAALLLGVTSFVVRGEASGTVVNNTVLLALTAAVLGWVAALSRDAAAARAEATALRAEQRERDRLGRVVHDGVLQVLAQVARRAPELGPNGAELAREAGAQEASLRALLSSSPAIRPGTSGRRDLAADLVALGSGQVEVAVPAGPVSVPTHTADELVAAVRAALDNTARHAPGARAWVLLEDDHEGVRVLVRDDGPGCESSRFAAAASEGRLGVSRSIVSRMIELGGTATLWSRPGQGVEVTLTVPAVP